MAEIYGSTTTTPIKPDLFTTTVDQIPDITSENAISNKAMIQYVANEVLNTEQFAKDYTDSRIDQNFDINSENAVSGKALMMFYWEFLVLQADVGDIETALDSIIAIQNNLIGGDA